MPTEKIPPKREFDDERQEVIPSAEGLKERRERRKKERQARKAKRESQELGEVGVADTPGNISPEETIGSAENISASWQEVKGLLDKEPEELTAADKELAGSFLERIKSKQFANKFYEDMEKAKGKEADLADALEGLIDFDLTGKLSVSETKPAETFSPEINPETSSSIPTAPVESKVQPARALNNEYSALSDKELDELLGEFKFRENRKKKNFNLGQNIFAQNPALTKVQFIAEFTTQNNSRPDKEKIPEDKVRAVARGVLYQLKEQKLIKKARGQGNNREETYQLKDQPKAELETKPEQKTVDEPAEEKVADEPGEEYAGWMPDINKITKQETIKPSESTKEEQSQPTPEPTPEPEQLPTLENVPPTEEKKKEIKKYNPKTLTPEEIEEGQKSKNDINKLTAQERSNLNTLDIEILSKKQERGIDDIRKDFAELKLRLSGINNREEAKELLSEILELSIECEKESYNKNEEDSEKSELKKLMETKKGGEAPAQIEGAEDEKPVDEVNKSEPLSAAEMERLSEEHPPEKLELEKTSTEVKTNEESTGKRARYLLNIAKLKQRYQEEGKEVSEEVIKNRASYVEADGILS